jgi:hypothetical protein
LDGKCGLNAARAFLQIPDVLFFGFADTAQRRTKACPDATLRLFAGVLDMCVIQRELCRDDSELCVTVEPLQALRRKKLFCIPIADLTGATNAENARIEACDGPNAALFRENAIPEMIDADADARDWTDAGDDCASSIHATTLFDLASK